MTRAGGLTVLGLIGPLVLPCGDSAASPDDDGEVRLSLPTEEDRAAWRRSGFRLALGAQYGSLRGAGKVPDLTLKGVVIRPGIRIDPEWSVYVPLHYVLTSHGGARFAAAVEPTWQITPNIAVGFGVGYAGLIGISTSSIARRRARRSIRGSRCATGWRGAISTMCPLIATTARSGSKAAPESITSRRAT